MPPTSIWSRDPSRPIHALGERPGRIALGVAGTRVVFGREGPLGGFLERTFEVVLVFTWRGAAIAAALVVAPHDPDDPAMSGEEVIEIDRGQRVPIDEG